MNVLSILAKLLGVHRVTYIKSKGKCLLTLYEGDKLKEIYAPDLLKEVAYDYREILQSYVDAAVTPYALNSWIRRSKLSSLLGFDSASIEEGVFYSNPTGNSSKFKVVKDNEYKIYTKEDFLNAYFIGA